MTAQQSERVARETARVPCPACQLAEHARRQWNWVRLVCPLCGHQAREGSRGVKGIGLCRADIAAAYRLTTPPENQIPGLRAVYTMLTPELRRLALERMNEHLELEMPARRSFDASARAIALEMGCLRK